MFLALNHISKSSDDDTLHKQGGDANAREITIRHPAVGVTAFVLRKPRLREQNYCRLARLMIHDVRIVVHTDPSSMGGCGDGMRELAVAGVFFGSRTGLHHGGDMDIAVGLHGANRGQLPMTDPASHPYASPSSGNNDARRRRRLTESTADHSEEEQSGTMVVRMAATNLPCSSNGQDPRLQDRGLQGPAYRFRRRIVRPPNRGLWPFPAAPSRATQVGPAKPFDDGPMFFFEAAQSFELGAIVKYALQAKPKWRVSRS